jgi:hypothetical protein
MKKLSVVVASDDSEFNKFDSFLNFKDPSINPAHEHKEDDPRIFVFGSNLKGLHGGGAAHYANTKLGAVMGVGEGRTGRTYALPTCYVPGRKRSLANVFKAVTTFLEHAEWCLTNEPDTRFFVTPVGCGIAGFKEEDIAPLFANAPENCDLPPGWREMA